MKERDSLHASCFCLIPFLSKMAGKFLHRSLFGGEEGQKITRTWTKKAEEGEGKGEITRDGGKKRWREE